MGFDLDLEVGLEIVLEENGARLGVLEGSDRVVDAPHEHTLEGLVGPEEL